MKKCKCGGYYIPMEDLDGMFCNKCGAHIDEEGDETDVDSIMGYTESRAKSMRGVPMTYIKIGSETKGRIEMAIPCYFSPSERKELIDSYLRDLKYTKEKINELNLDIYTGRK